ncbi:bifunctional DNA primase/polymerase [Sinomonas sp. G460-2]|uniref:bifunctional DNA primase/polymerase n=1 Tax=Sinomonas sp. G460-2 TaxID=3393464 RepID=UPI0039EEA47F
MDPAELFIEVAKLSLAEAAARFAAAGAPVFPCAPGGKRPLTARGFHDATADAGRVVSWWRRWPGANIGMPTGATSGLEVVDVDRKAGGSGFDSFDQARRAGLVGRWLVLVRTPSGGMHAYYPADPARPQPSWQAASARVDFRGEGGYVILPPSVVELKAGLRASYMLISSHKGAVSPVDAMALRNLLDPRRDPVASSRGIVPVTDGGRLAAWVASRGEGERNRGLFWAACRMAEAGASAEATQGLLAPAAEQAGLPSREVDATIRSAYRATRTGPQADDVSGRDVAARRTAQVKGHVLS